MRSVRQISALIGLALMVHAPLSAQGCARPDGDAAARLVEFNALMLATSLRCRMIGTDITPDYDRLLSAHAQGFKGADEALLAGFSGVTPRAQRLAYDQYKISLSNIYGGGKSSKSSCSQFGRVFAELSTSSMTDVQRVAKVLIPRPHPPATAACQSAP